MTSKKKKFIIIAAVAICVVIFALAIKAQSIYTSTISNKQMSAEKTPNKSSGTIQTGGENQGSANGAGENGENSAASGKLSNASGSSSSKGVSKSNGKNGQTSLNKGSSSKNSGTSAVNSQKSDNQSSLEIIDAVHGNKVIFQKSIQGVDGQTVGYATQKALDAAKMSYTTRGSGSTIYFSDIGGLKERAEGPMSGWCFYVKKKGQSQFTKSNVGSGQYVLKNGDSVMWKYVKNGM